ncbi:MAG: ABC transporter permease [Clostridia bacterium]|nr:ABC transporter permease [Clostridia bacterium]
MKILNIIKFDLIKLSRDKTLWFFILILPIFLTFVIGAAMGSATSTEEPKIPVAIVNNDTSKLSMNLMDEIKKDKTIYIEELKEDEIYDRVKNARVEVGFIIPKDFGVKYEKGETPEIKVLKLPSSVDYRAIEGIINNAFTKLGMMEGTKAYFSEKMRKLDSGAKKVILEDISKKVGENLQKTPVVSVQNTRYTGDKESIQYNGKAQSSIGMAVMFVMFTLIMGSGQILEEKKQNTWARLITSPTHSSTLLFGRILSTFIKGWVQIFLLIIFGKFVMGVNWGSSLPATIIVMSVYLLSVTSIGMFLASIVKTNAQLGAFSSVFIISSSMLSGCYWPVEIMPENMQQIAAFLPQYWAMKALTSTVVGSMGLEAVIKPLAVLVCIGIVFFVLNIIRGGTSIGLKRQAALEQNA